MNPEPLKGKKELDDFDGYCDENTPYKFSECDVKSAVEGLIKFHEDRIEGLIKELKIVIAKDSKYKLSSDNTKIYIARQPILNEIRKEYESIMAIEHWLEDVI